MLKCSHAFVASKISEAYNLSIINKICLTIGSIIPDCKISCFTTPHCRKNWQDKADDLLYDLKECKTHNAIFYYKLGVLLHLYADFYTYPHTDFSYHYIKSGHAKWERNLHKELKKVFTIIKPNYTNINDYEPEYNNSVRDVKTDSVYISLIMSFICEYVYAYKEDNIQLPEFPSLFDYLNELLSFPEYSDFLFSNKYFIKALTNNVLI